MPGSIFKDIISELCLENNILSILHFPCLNEMFYIVMTYVKANYNNRYIRFVHLILNNVMRWLGLHLVSETVSFSSEKYYKQYKHRRIHSKYQVGDDIYGKVLRIKISKWPGNISNRLLRRKSILIVFKCVFTFLIND